jgi:hypothetical protein
MARFNIKSRLGAIPSPWDIRNYRVRPVTKLESESIPESYEGLDIYLPKPPITEAFPDQGNVGTCVGWDFMSVMETQYHLIDKIFDELSASWIYQKSRDYSSPPITDIQGEGSTNFGACRALNYVGASTRTLCPEDINSPYVFNPQEGADVEAKKYTVDQYWDVNPNIADVKAAIYGITHEMPYKMPDGSPGKTPIASAFPVYNSFRDSFTNGGVVPLPKLGDSLEGGHSSMLCGWKVIDGKTHTKNFGSWGDDMADKGFFWIPADYPFYSGDFKLLHMGPPTEDPNPPTPSPCTRGNSVAKVLNVVPQLLRRKGRFFYLNK